ncbi:hypothetical protein C1J01_42325 [Nonomuraea aridisoli]|uniref:AraC-type transcription regulator ligand-binding domain-containing protein n=1 Tax=Nonomuraea aridisoli TaxID=2070368 RepID=A0A2W2EAN9_9ACTN|nr:hypothetical protein C1J01_42325 [Nonomuraea aridisoli]
MPCSPVIVGGSISLDDTTATLLGRLPAAACIPAGGDRARALRPVPAMPAEETADEPPGSVVMIDHLTNVLFVQALRAYLAGPEKVGGRLGALHDPQIGAALALTHRRATHPWSVAALAAAWGTRRRPRSATPSNASPATHRPATARLPRPPRNRRRPRPRDGPDRFVSGERQRAGARDGRRGHGDAVRGRAAAGQGAVRAGDSGR